jgi:hypothetical protein
MTKNKSFLSRGVITDFLILTALFFALSYSFFAFYKLLYHGSENPGQITVITEAVPAFYEKSIRTDDAIYDPITKRKIGTVEECQSVADNGDKIRFIIKISAEHMPRGNSLRTKKLWFQYRITE